MLFADYHSMQAGVGFKFVYTKQQIKAVNMKEFFTLLLTLLAAGGCKKSSPTSIPAPPSAAINTPGLIGPAYQPGVPFNVNAFNIYDLNYDNNSDKKYFTIELYSVDSARVIMEPKPIDSLAANWPAAVKKIRWSAGLEFIVDELSFIRITGGNFYQIQYNQASPQHAWLSRYKSTIAPPGLPNAEVTFSSGNYKLFYFINKTGFADVFAYQNTSGTYYNTLDLLNAMGQAFNAYDWRDVSNLIWLPGQNALFFFDFKNWLYWRIDKRNGVGQDWVGTPPKSLDHFLKWPAGWGKK